jgi:hypothetical protein
VGEPGRETQWESRGGKHSGRDGEGNTVGETGEGNTVGETVRETQ